MHHLVDLAIGFGRLLYRSHTLTTCHECPLPGKPSKPTLSLGQQNVQQDRLYAPVSPKPDPECLQFSWPVCLLKGLWQGINNTTKQQNSINSSKILLLTAPRMLGGTPPPNAMVTNVNKEMANVLMVNNDLIFSKTKVIVDLLGATTPTTHQNQAAMISYQWVLCQTFTLLALLKFELLAKIKGKSSSPHCKVISDTKAKVHHYHLLGEWC